MRKILLIVIAALIIPAACAAGDKLVKAASGKEIFSVPKMLTSEEEMDIVRHLDILENLDFLLKLEFIEGYTGLYAVTEDDEKTKVK